VLRRLGSVRPRQKFVNAGSLVVGDPAEDIAEPGLVRVGNSRNNKIAVNHFLSGDYNSKAQQKLREELARGKGTT
jgi:hypothetical protein